jgi:hypothetical protein
MSSPGFTPQSLLATADSGDLAENSYVFPGHDYIRSDEMKEELTFARWYGFSL